MTYITPEQPYGGWYNVSDLGLMGVNKFTPVVGISAALGIGCLALGIFGIAKAFSKGGNKLTKAGIPLVASIGMGVTSVLLFNKEKEAQGTGVASAAYAATPGMVARRVSSVAGKPAPFTRAEAY